MSCENLLFFLGADNSPSEVIWLLLISFEIEELSRVANTNIRSLEAMLMGCNGVGRGLRMGIDERKLWTKHSSTPMDINTANNGNKEECIRFRLQ